MQSMTTTGADDPAIGTDTAEEDPAIISGRIGELASSVRAMVEWRSSGGRISRQLVREACGDWIRELTALRLKKAQTGPVS